MFEAGFYEGVDCTVQIGVGSYVFMGFLGLSFVCMWGRNWKSVFGRQSIIRNSSNV